MKKIELCRMNCNRHIESLRCPLCESPCAPVEAFTLFCHNGHAFDLSSKGYANLVPHKRSSGKDYQKELFQSRASVFACGFFDPLLKRLQELTSPALDNGGKILDAGCGEGSLLSLLITALRRDFDEKDISGIGIDLAKEGIACTPGSEHCLWLVGDLAALPFADHEIDVILNVLAPANYNEFQRVLKKDGLLIKVRPGERHLIELRDYFAIKKMPDSFKADQGETLSYAFPVDQQLRRHIAEMTPLSWNRNEAEKRGFAMSAIKEITADFTILSSV